MSELPLVDRLRAMEKGADLFIPADDGKPDQVVRQTLINIRQRDRTRLYTSRREDGGRRVWRLA